MESTESVWDLLEEDVITGPHERLTRFDSVIRHRGMNPESVMEAFNGGVQDATLDEVEAALDSIYIAAGAGNRHAKYLIHVAAMAELSNVDTEALANGLGDETEIVPILESHEIGRLEPTRNIFQTLALLDSSLAAIEVCIDTTAEHRKIPSGQEQT